MPTYFAYGSNMDRAAMARRCPRSVALGTARLARHRPALTPAGYATVASEPRGIVWGLLWDLALADVPALDRWEEVSRGMYSKATMPVVRHGGAAVRALIYIGNDVVLAGAGASAAYGAAIVAAAKDLELPAAYTAQLQALYGLDAGRRVTR